MILAVKNVSFYSADDPNQDFRRLMHLSSGQPFQRQVNNYLNSIQTEACELGSRDDTTDYTLRTAVSSICVSFWNTFKVATYADWNLSGEKIWGIYHVRYCCGNMLERYSIVYPHALMHCDRFRQCWNLMPMVLADVRISLGVISRWPNSGNAWYVEYLPACYCYAMEQ